MLIKVSPKDLQPTPLPEGVYKSTMQCTVKTAASGNLMVSVEHTVTTQGPDLTEKTIGRKVFDNLVLTEESLWRVNSTFKAVTGEDLPEGEFEIDELAGIISSRLSNQEATIQVKNEVRKDTGEVQSRIKKYL